MPNSTDTKLNELVINETTEELLKSQEIQPNQIYVTPDEDGPQITKTSQLENDGEDGSSPYATKEDIAGIDILEPASQSKLGGVRVWVDRDSFLNISTEKLEIVNNLALIKNTSTNSYKVESVVDKNADTINIPDSYNGLVIDEICEYAFADMINIKTITIGKNIKRMGTGAFSGCINCDTINFNAINFEDNISEDIAKKYYISNIFGPMLLESLQEEFAENESLNDIINLVNNKVLLKNIWTDTLWFYNVGINVSDGITINFGNNVSHIPSFLFSPRFNTYNTLFEALPANINYSFSQKITMAFSTDFELGGATENDENLNKCLKRFIERRDDYLTNVINIKKINWGTGIDSIGVGAFAYSNIETDIYFPDNITTINSFAFLGASTFSMSKFIQPHPLLLLIYNSAKPAYCINSLIIPNTIKYVGYRVFDGLNIDNLVFDSADLINTEINLDSTSCILYLAKEAKKLYELDDSYPELLQILGNYILYIDAMYHYRMFFPISLKEDEIPSPCDLSIPSNTKLLTLSVDQTTHYSVADSLFSKGSLSGDLYKYSERPADGGYSRYTLLEKINITNNIPDYITITDLNGSEISEMWPRDRLKIVYKQSLSDGYSVKEINTNPTLGQYVAVWFYHKNSDYLPRNSEELIDSTVIPMDDNIYRVNATVDILFDLCYDDIYYSTDDEVDKIESYYPSRIYSSKNIIKILDTYKDKPVTEINENLFVPMTYKRIELGINSYLSNSADSGYNGEIDLYHWDWASEEFILKNDSQYRFFDEVNTNIITKNIYVLKSVDDNAVDRNTFLDDTNLWTKSTTMYNDEEYYLYTRN